VYLGIGDLDVPWPQGCTVALGVKVKVMRWDWDRELLTGRTLGLVTEVHHGPEVYRGPGVKVKVKVTC